mgnify:CR=1 FL=1
MSMDLIFSKIKQLPVIPKLLHELMQDFSSDNSRIEDIAKKIAMDQVISAKVLKMANSAAYRRGPEITSIEQAVIRLGFNSLRSLVVASGLMTSFRTPSNFDKNKFWVDNFQVATIAKTKMRTAMTVNGNEVSWNAVFSTRSFGPRRMEIIDTVANNYLVTAAPLFLALGFLVFFYCLSALHDDRRDRSILFWKSLPVSDTATVLSKAVRICLECVGIG